ncbi:MAG TPA: hypothetical protein VJZ93_00185 [Candidatus Nanoarchaeia archaeon]|nr:hypothetical protein [Candidatus Nanoarchaeia archaeon]
MLDKFLKEVVVEIVGKQYEEIVDLLNKEKYVNEFIVAKKMNLTVNQIRNILYRLSDNGVVSFIRKKDKRKGWYTYFWRIEILKSLELLKDTIVKKIGRVVNQISMRETKVFYVCRKCNIEMDEENALVHDFTCPECGSIFEIKDDSKLIKELRKNLEKYQSELPPLEKEINVEKEKRNKKKDKEVKKEEKIKKDKRDAKRKLRMSLKIKKTIPPKNPRKKSKNKSKKKSAKKSPRSKR